MKIDVVVIGKPKTAFVKNGVEHYLTRLKGLAPVKIIPVKAEPMTKSSLPEKVKSAEAERLLARVDERTVVVALDPTGKQPQSSEKLAAMLTRWESSGRNRLAFIIGGPLGLDESVKKRADAVVALSRLTFSHELCLLTALEQLYRGLSIKAGLPYAK